MQTLKSKKQSVSKKLNAIIAEGEKQNNEWMDKHSTFVKGNPGESRIVILSGPFEIREQTFSPDRPKINIIDLNCLYENDTIPRIYSHPCFPMPRASALTRTLQSIFASHNDELEGIKLKLTFGIVNPVKSTIGVIDINEV
jgi:hypothetical protein